MHDTSRTPTGRPVEIVEYRSHHRNAFRELNLEWIAGDFVVEAADRIALDDPEGSILRPGGHILMAEDGDQVLGTCALIRLAPHVFELAKMAVAPSARGRGIGELLGRAAVERAKRLGAQRIELVSNTALQPALGLYRKLGFTEAPLGPTEYQRANIRMILDLAAQAKTTQSETR